MRMYTQWVCATVLMIAPLGCSKSTDSPEPPPKKSWRFEYVGGWSQPAPTAGASLSLAPQEAAPVAIFGNYFLVGDVDFGFGKREVDTNRVYVVDVSSPVTPVTAGTYQYAYADGPWVFTSLLAGEAEAYVFMRDTLTYPRHFRMLALDISNPTQPTLSHELTMRGDVLRQRNTFQAPAALMNDSILAWVTEGTVYPTSAIEFYNTRGSEGPQLIGSVQMSEVVQHLYGQGHYMYCLLRRRSGDMGLAVFDVSNPQDVRAVTQSQQVVVSSTADPVRLNDTLLYGDGGARGAGSSST